MKTLFSMMMAVLFVVGSAGMARADGAQMFGKKCAGCHGKDAKGATTMGKKLNIKDLTDAKVQAASTDAQWEKNHPRRLQEPRGQEAHAGVQDYARRGQGSGEDPARFQEVTQEFARRLVRARHARQSRLHPGRDVQLQSPYAVPALRRRARAESETAKAISSRAIGCANTLAASWSPEALASSPSARTAWLKVAVKSPVTT